MKIMIDVESGLRPKELIDEILSEKHGNIFTVHFGPKKMVVLAGYDIVKDALVNHADDFGDRADIPIFRRLTGGHGIGFSHGEAWKVMRRFTLSTLRDFGMGKRTVEDSILDELHPLIKHFESHKGKPFNARIILNSAVSNVICSIIFGKRFDYEDPTFLTLINLLAENIKLLGAPTVQLYNYYPALAGLFGAHKTVEGNVNQQVAFLQDFFEEHRKELDANNVTGFIDAYLLKQEQESKNGSTHFNEKNLTYSTLDLFAAGTETTSTTLRWGLLLLMKYPEIQRKVHKEIDNVIKPGQVPKVEDRRNMPYTDAVLHEIQRFANILPLNVSRATNSDVHFRGYFIPKGTEVIPLLISVLYDKSQWETPYTFNPQHFLDEDGKFLRKDAFLPFSAGRRACVGESLAKMELFLFFTGLLQRFTFHPPSGVTEADLDLTAEVGFTLTPAPHCICAVAREPMA
ncbi:cytochrome P450 2W1 [Ambystoma mexicanum]|uniref:cytochrome P450 2W1 n=1 Tax=Ambystoma mexicanum TaxID=8296 RepID=UPI0037E80054